ncbi:MAG: gluconate 2-dehydrogenase subunit 3 family protein [Bryobacterales bacterium]|nr:gluconate 2-dehydrogenase subunit 3 family protein [Bryobacterales bacterium]
MRRRRLLHAMTLLPVAPAAAQYNSQNASSDEMPKLRETGGDAVAQGRTRLLTPLQLATFRNLANILVPKADDRPGAVEAGAVEFLDFLLSQSASERKILFQQGLNALHGESQKRLGKPFAELTPAEAKQFLEPLSRPWSYHAAKDPQERFLREAKEDLLQATANSRPFAEAMSKRSRSAGGMGAYWLPLD